MSAIAVMKGGPIRISQMNWAKNSLVPAANLYANMASQLNHIAGYRRKCIFSVDADMITTPPTGAINRWRWRARSGHMARAFQYVFVIGMSGVTSGDCSVSVGQTIAGGGTTTVTAFAGTNTAGKTVLRTPDEIQIITETADCTANTEYEFVASQTSRARLIGLCVYELSSVFDTTYGYISPNFSVASPIYDNHRSEMLELATNLWKRNGSHLINFSVEQDSSPVTPGTTAANVIDGAVAEAASSAGYTMDLSYLRSRGSSAVPVTICAYGNTSGAITGNVYLYNGAGAQLSLTGIGNTLQWYTATGTLPAASDKLDIFASRSGAGTFNLYAVSVYQYEA